MAVWGIYPIRPLGKRQAGDSASRDEVKWQVRWRVEGVARKRTFARKGHAKDFHDRLTVASVNGWHADLRGYPVDPAGQTSPGRTLTTQPAEAHPDAETQLRAGLSFADYCTTTWWPINETRFKGKNLLGHRPRDRRRRVDPPRRPGRRRRTPRACPATLRQRPYRRGQPAHHDQGTDPEPDRHLHRTRDGQ